VGQFQNWDYDPIKLRDKFNGHLRGVDGLLTLERSPYVIQSNGEYKQQHKQVEHVKIIADNGFIVQNKMQRINHGGCGVHAL